MAQTSTPVRDGFLRVLGAVTTPLVPADYLDVIDPLRSGAALRGRIQAGDRAFRVVFRRLWSGWDRALIIVDRRP